MQTYYNLIQIAFNSWRIQTISSEFIGLIFEKVYKTKKKTTDVHTFELADTVSEGRFPYALSLQADINYKLFSVIDLSSLVEVGLQWSFL